ncbi:BMC domain-containing protein [Neomoorella humiferrea]|uniref:BMC domain-containing protein n=1 Tax=Neomoorella humiferrea TaxID=676965 RepID=UPI003D94D904
MIQTDGLPALIAAADTALKTAEVQIGPVELVRGGRMVLIRLYGEISAVQAAVDAGIKAALQITPRAIGSVIGRPQLTI